MDKLKIGQIEIGKNDKVENWDKMDKIKYWDKRDKIENYDKLENWDKIENQELGHKMDKTQKRLRLFQNDIGKMSGYSK